MASLSSLADIGRSMGTAVSGVGRTTGRGVKKVAHNLQRTQDGIDYNALGSYMRGIDREDYINRYRASMDEARGSISSQYGAALADIASNEQKGQALIGGLPAQYQGIYGGADQAMQATAAKAGEVANATGMAGTNNAAIAGMNIAPAQQAIQMEQAGALAGVPAMSLALTGAASSRRSEIQQAQASSLAEMAQREQQAIMDYDNGIQQREFDQEDQQTAWDHEEERYKQQQQQAAKQQASGVRYGPMEVNPDRGGAMNDANSTEYDPQAVARIRADQNYKDLVKRISKIKKGKKLLEFINHYSSKHPNRSRGLSLALFDTGISSRVQ